MVLAFASWVALARPVGAEIYGLAVLLGAGSATILVTSLSMTADLIGTNTVRPLLLWDGAGQAQSPGAGVGTGWGWRCREGALVGNPRVLFPVRAVPRSGCAPFGLCSLLQ